MIDITHALPYTSRVINEIDIPCLSHGHSGKVRESFDLGDGRRLIIATDRLSAFDRHICSIPFKGRVLTQTARLAFEATEKYVPNHVIEYIDPNVIVAKQLEIIPIEIVVRDFLAGNTETSLWTMYKKGLRHIGDVNLLEDMVENEMLPETIITPTTKSADHDMPITCQEIIAGGLVTKEEWEFIEHMALTLFGIGSHEARNRGLILADTKYEFGRDKDGKIFVADEIHTPDSSRYWVTKNYQTNLSAGTPQTSFDKDVIRRWLNERCNPYEDELPPIPPLKIAETAAVYVNAFERLTGEEFPLDLNNIDPSNRISRNVHAWLEQADLI